MTVIADLCSGRGWGALSALDLEADLAESEELGAPSGPPAKLLESTEASEEELRATLKERFSADAARRADAFLAARREQRATAAQLQAALVEVESLQFDAASLVASIAQGPFKAPSVSPAPGAAPGSGGGGDEHVFGEAAAAKEAAPEDFRRPAEASSLSEYTSRMAAFPKKLLVRRKLPISKGSLDVRQDEKDIGRDELVVNGEAISGARGGYTAAVAALRDAMVAQAAGQGAAATQAELAAQLLLSALNRTSSGFAAFEEVLRLFDCPDAVIVAPVSAAARPLEAAVLRDTALGRAHTQYTIRRVDTTMTNEAPVATIDAEFVFRVPVAKLLDPSAVAAADEALDASFDADLGVAGIDVPTLRGGDGAVQGPATGAADWDVDFDFDDVDVAAPAPAPVASLDPVPSRSPGEGLPADVAHSGAAAAPAEGGAWDFDFDFEHREDGAAPEPAPEAPEAGPATASSAPVGGSGAATGGDEWGEFDFDFETNEGEAAPEVVAVAPGGQQASASAVQPADQAGGPAEGGGGWDDDFDFDFRNHDEEVAREPAPEARISQPASKPGSPPASARAGGAVAEGAADWDVDFDVGDEGESAPAPAPVAPSAPKAQQPEVPVAARSGKAPRRELLAHCAVLLTRREG